MSEEADAGATSLSLLDDCLTGLYTSHVSCSRASRRERRASSRGSSRAAAAASLPAAAGASPEVGSRSSPALFPEPVSERPKDRAAAAARGGGGGGAAAADAADDRRARFAKT